MTYRITLDLKCGKTTCYNGNGYCQFLGRERFGTVLRCLVFNQELSDQNGVSSGPGRLQRVQECLKAQE
jgi:hypothetical protein